MAEAPESRVRYFCHQCADSIYPEIPDYVCPRCHSGFIEEITPDNDSANTADLDGPAAQFAELWERTFLDSFRQHSNSENSSLNNGPANPLNRPRLNFQPRRMGYNQESAGLEFIINHLLHTLTTGGLMAPGTDGAFGMPLNLIHLHGNPGDYAWGADGLDSIVTQLLGQLEGSGPPPASKEQIDKLPKRTITDADVANTLQCSVCMEDYSKGESVRCLPCQHVYHDDCIKPWLERHGSCPVCRKDLDGQDTSRQDDDHHYDDDDDDDDDGRNENEYENCTTSSNTPTSSSSETSSGTASGANNASANDSNRQTRNFGATRAPPNVIRNITTSNRNATNSSNAGNTNVLNGFVDNEECD